MILVAGQAIYDFFQQKADGSAVTFAARPGGAPFNVAVGLKRMGQPTAFFGTLSSDAMGGRLHQALVAEGIDPSFVKRSAWPTALAIVGTNAQGTPAFSFYGEHPAHCDLQASDLPDIPDACSAVYVGCFPLVQEPVAATLLALVRRGHGQRVVVYDPNVRLSIEPDINRWRKSFADFSALADIIKIGSEDFSALFPDDRPDALAARLLASGASLILYTEGEKGARIFARHGSVHHRPPPVLVQDTVGAGDTAIAALMAGLAEKGLLHRDKLSALQPAQLKPLLAMACNAAAITCTRIGADPPRRDQIFSD
ncbi:MAG: carbohydrate kinase family protein [Beijerinckiaceae bacterium]